MSNRYVCVHGHFYQPPRENPFTGELDEQPSAAPYANWNERITAESYAPNLAVDLGPGSPPFNNFEWISFDFGPTVLSWLEKHHPGTYLGLLESDRMSRTHFGGHGSAMAHAYNHTILPLSNTRDKVTQVKWGLADFRHRYGREPEGMWLPETAVDAETLQILADEGLRFTVLSPYQAATVTGNDGVERDVSNGSIDPRRAYEYVTGDDSRIAVFFYNGALSQEIAFDGLLNDGGLLAARLVDALGAAETELGFLSHVATDGETYGHHHTFGDMALASALMSIATDSTVQLTNYGQFLELSPPQERVEVIDESSWSCAHGVERWRSDCGCSTGGEPGWRQGWRAPLRASLDWMREGIDKAFESLGGPFIDPWGARNAYISVLLGGSIEAFLEEHCQPGLAESRPDFALSLMEMQRHAMFMYTSCGWFFNDVAGLETVFILRHAGRAIQLARECLDIDLEPGFVSLLRAAESNHLGTTAADVYAATVGPYMSVPPPESRVSAG